ncbi:hypothetical protein J5N97_003276 [Dioscorea zingiberensis]|uniref:protein-serine/threonine phosphatase n=1 Tax=Dioscorea zingiberensis TaxID=325984 RepID=A0A9D5D3T5_9LILI|nr:hypothetical protein J5N97_003276 [Dioscorea zingiberensis]
MSAVVYSDQDKTTLITHTVVALNSQGSGTTTTFVIIDGWVVTVASIGDFLCILESAEGSVHFLSAHHRLEVNEDEVKHVITSGVRVRRLNTVGGAERLST